MKRGNHYLDNLYTVYFNTKTIFCIICTCTLAEQLLDRLSRIFKLLRTPGINSTESIAYKLPPLSKVMGQVTLQECPLNVIFIRHCSIYSMGAGRYLLQIPYLVHTQFQESVFLPSTHPKILPQDRQQKKGRVISAKPVCNFFASLSHKRTMLSTSFNATSTEFFRTKSCRLCSLCTGITINIPVVKWRGT